VTEPALYITSAERAMLMRLLARHLSGCTLWAFGSRVPGWPGSRGLKAHSDLDLAVIGQPTALALAALRADLEESDLPWRVDLCEFDALPPALRELITRHGQTITP
jgi:predicted nucleotidyltransferase